MIPKCHVVQHDLLRGAATTVRVPCADSDGRGYRLRLECRCAEWSTGHGQGEMKITWCVGSSRQVAGAGRLPVPGMGDVRWPPQYRSRSSFVIRSHALLGPERMAAYHFR